MDLCLRSSWPTGSGSWQISGGRNTCRNISGTAAVRSNSWRDVPAAARLISCGWWWPLRGKSIIRPCGFRQKISGCMILKKSMWRYFTNATFCPVWRRPAAAWSGRWVMTLRIFRRGWSLSTIFPRMAKATRWRSGRYARSCGGFSWKIRWWTTILRWPAVCWQAVF